MLVNGCVVMRAHAMQRRRGRLGAIGSVFKRAAALLRDDCCGDGGVQDRDPAGFWSELEAGSAI
jgi:hypothetical protein